MGRKCTAQPTASDMFFLAYKAGLLDLKKGEIGEVLPDGVRTKDGDKVECSVLLKCLGWEEPPLRAVFPEFSSRRFIFLNGSASIVMVSDPHYQHRAVNSTRGPNLRDVAIKGGTFSVLTLAHVCIRLQLFFMDHPEQFSQAMAGVAESGEAVCSWFQQKWDFEGLPELNTLIDETLNMYKDQTRAKFKDAAAYIKMAEQCYRNDLSKFLPEPVGYIFRPDGSGNFFDLPKQTVISRPPAVKGEASGVGMRASALQTAAYGGMSSI